MGCAHSPISKLKRTQRDCTRDVVCQLEVKQCDHDEVDSVLELNFVLGKIALPAALLVCNAVGVSAPRTHAQAMTDGRQ